MENDPAKVLPIRLKLFDNHRPLIEFLWIDTGQSISVLEALTTDVSQIT
jgi:hypothetical protein